MKHMGFIETGNWPNGVLAIIAIAVACWGCNEGVTIGDSSSGNTVEGVLLGGGGQGVEIELRKWEPGRPGQGGAFVALGHTTSDMNGRFTLEPQKGLVMDFYQLMVDKAKPLVLVMDSTEHVSVEAHIPESGFILDAKIEGSQGSSDANIYYSVAMPLQQNMQMLRTGMQYATEADKKQSFSDRSVATKEAINQWALEFIETYPQSNAQLGPLEHLDVASHLSVFKQVLQRTKSSLAHGSYFGALSSAMQLEIKRQTGLKQPRIMPKGQGTNTPRPKKNSKYGVGDAAPEIAMNGVDGQERKLSDLRGKVVLIDFWASWCGPCRRENPTVVRAYEELKGKGFEVFSVSLDQNQDKWEAAIAQDGLTWPNHVSDLTGWSNAAARSYGVRSIPHTVLVDRDGTIISTHLRGNALLAKLSESL